MTKPNARMLSVDPGDPAGLALWRLSDGVLLWRTQADFNRLCGLLTELRQAGISDVVYEDFRLLRKKALQQSGSRFETSQVIGVLRYFAYQTKANVHVSRPEALHMASLHSGVKMPSDHTVSHEVSAQLHGYYWLEQQGIIVSKVPLVVD